MHDSATLRLPRNCTEVQIALPGARDGHYTLDIHGQPGVIFCHRMNTSTPQAFITLYHLNRFDREYKGTGKTYFQKVAVNLEVGLLEIDWLIDLFCFNHTRKFTMHYYLYMFHISLICLSNMQIHMYGKEVYLEFIYKLWWQWRDKMMNESVILYD